MLIIWFYLLFKEFLIYFILMFIWTTIHKWVITGLIRNGLLFWIVIRFYLNYFILHYIYLRKHTYIGCFIVNGHMLRYMTPRCAFHNETLCIAKNMYSSLNINSLHKCFFLNGHHIFYNLLNSIFATSHKYIYLLLYVILSIFVLLTHTPVINMLF